MLLIIYRKLRKQNFINFKIMIQFKIYIFFEKLRLLLNHDKKFYVISVNNLFIQDNFADKKDVIVDFIYKFCRNLFL